MNALIKKRLWSKMLALEKSAMFYNIQEIGEEPAENYFGKSIMLPSGMTVTNGFKVYQIFNQMDAVATTYVNGIHGTGRTGIYSLHSERTMPNDLKLHELAHLASRKGDIALAKSLELRIDGKVTRESASQALGAYFASGCNPSLLKKRNRRNR